MAFWVGLGAVVLYLGYRWYSNRNASSSSTATTDTSGTDTGAGTSDGTTGDNSAPPTPTGIDQTQPPTDTVPPSEPINLPNGTNPLTKLLDKTGKKKKAKTKQHPVTHHDHKQGTTHTKTRRLPVAKSPNHHAPKTTKVAHSNVKKAVTAGPKAHSGGVGAKHPATTHPPAVKAPTPKTLPHAAAVEHSAPAKAAKAPPKKSGVKAY